MKPAPDIVFVTYDDLKQGDPDDGLALDILSARGFNCSFADWRDQSFPFTQSRLVILRSTWNYHLYQEEFVQWAKNVAAHTILKNSPELVDWNHDKRYLRQLSESGLRIAPTFYIEKNSAPVKSFEEILAVLYGPAEPISPRIVVKPSVGLSTFGVKKFDLAESGGQQAAREHINQLGDNYCVMVQPFLDEVEGYGERALVFIDGKFSHAIRKSAFQHLAVAGEAGEARVQATESEIEFGRRVLTFLPETPLYARVDMVPDRYGRQLLLELELIEPSLFLQVEPGAAEKFADAVQACLSVN